MQGGPNTTWRFVGVVVALVVGGVLIGLYISGYLVGNTPAFRPAVQGGATPTVNLTIETVAAVGPSLAPNHPDWVSYLVRDGRGTWERTTVWDLPANATVHVTLYNFDGASGLRNPFFGRPTGIVGPELVDGKPLAAMNPDDTSHTFAVPALGIVVPVRPSATTRRSSAATRRARSRWRTGRSLSPSRRARPATTAGSASSPAPRATCSVSAARCRRSATWTGS